MKYRLIIEDVQHSGFKGLRGTSKKGGQYEARKGFPFNFDEDYYHAGCCAYLDLERPRGGGIYTTPFEKSYELDSKYYIETMNSIYVCKIVDKIQNPIAEKEALR